jgi:hypothetical protein
MLWLALKIGKLALSGRLSESVSWLWPAFKIGDLALAGFQKLSAQLPEICYPIGAKDLNLRF